MRNLPRTHTYIQKYTQLCGIDGSHDDDNDNDRKHDQADNADDEPHDLTL